MRDFAIIVGYYTNENKNKKIRITTLHIVQKLPEDSIKTEHNLLSKDSHFFKKFYCCVLLYKLPLKDIQCQFIYACADEAEFDLRSYNSKRRSDQNIGKSFILYHNLGGNIHMS
ncbi:hypothetical protein GQX74_013400 [Glossina fuscipes]|nr:hypothetical protein GQX74_013400 [Glossina fuscipes]